MLSPAQLQKAKKLLFPKKYTKNFRPITIKLWPNVNPPNITLPQVLHFGREKNIPRGGSQLGGYILPKEIHFYLNDCSCSILVLHKTPALPPRLRSQKTKRTAKAEPQAKCSLTVHQISAPMDVKTWIQSTQLHSNMGLPHLERDRELRPPFRGFCDEPLAGNIPEQGGPNIHTYLQVSENRGAHLCLAENTNFNTKCHYFYI